MAWFLARETKDLLMGEPANSASAIVSGLARMNGLFTVQLGPDFVGSLSAADVERITMTMEAKMKALHPKITALLIRLQRPAHT
jgi:hypothetical protein